MSFNDEIIEDVDDFLNVFGESTTATYTPYGGSGKLIAIVLQYLEQTHEDNGEGSSMETKRARIHISRDATDGITTPTVRDTVTISGTIWAVESIEEIDAGMATLIIINETDHEYAQQRRA